MKLSGHFREIFGIFLCYDGPLRCQRVQTKPAGRCRQQGALGSAGLQGGEEQSDAVPLWRLCPGHPAL